MLTLQHSVRLAPGTRLQHDRVRQRRVLLGPERMLIIDDMAELILSRLQGQTLAALCAQLVTEFDAPAAEVEHDVLALFDTLCEKGFVLHDG